MAAWGTDDEVVQEDGGAFGADDEVVKPQRRGGTRSEFTQALTAAREALGPVEPDPLTTRQARQPLPDGVMPSQAGGGRGFVREAPGARQAFTSGSQPFRDRREALDEAVNLLDEGVDPQKVYARFGAKDLGVTQREIEAHGVARGSPFFAPQTTRPANNELMSGPTGFDEISPVEPSGLQEVGNTVRRGAEQFKQSIDAGRFLAGSIDASQMAEQARIGNRRMGAIAPSGDVAAGMERLQQANKSGEWGPVLEAVASPRNWKALASMVVESAVATGPGMIAGSLATALSGGLGGMPVATAASFAQEYSAALADELEKRGIDASDPVKMATALSDPDIRQAIDERGRIRGAAVGAFDGITMGVAGALGRTLRRAQMAGTLTKGKAIGGAALGAGVEIGGGMAGEFIGQKGVGDSKPLDVVIEGLAEGPSGVADVAAGFLTPRTKPNEPAPPPSQARTASIDRFGELAAGFGLPEKALSKAREAAANMPAGDVPGFLAKLADAYNQRGLFAKPLDPAAITELQTAIDGPPEVPSDAEKNAAVDAIEATLKAAGALPDEALNVTGLADATPEAPVDAVWLSAEADVPVQVVGPAQAGPDGREYTPVVGPDGAQSFLPADELIEADRKAANDQPVVPDPAASVPGAGADGAGAPGAGAGAVRPVADDANGAPAVRAAAADAGGGSGVSAGRDGAPDAALNAAAQVSTQAPEKSGATEAAAPTPTVRQLGSYGRTPSGATPVELRPNADGTLTPYTGKYPMVDYETGDPISIPADATDAEAVDAIRAAKAIVAKDKFFGIKGNATATTTAKAEPVTEDAAAAEQEDAEAPAPTREAQVADARRRIDGLKILLKCLTS
jgi:hypothetical protein